MSNPHERALGAVGWEMKMNEARNAVLALSAMVAIAGCGGATVTPDDGGGSSDASAPTTFAQQVALGGAAYGEHCAHCHGAGGEGGETAPRLVGLSEGALPLEPREGAVRTTQFVTVADVAAFAVANMPADAPGSLSADTYWAILAFDLSANGITLDEMLTPELAATLTIPR